MGFVRFGKTMGSSGTVLTGQGAGSLEMNKRIEAVASRLAHMSCFECIAEAFTILSACATVAHKAIAIAWL